MALPAAGSAAETFGSRFKNNPNYGACDALTAPCTYVSFIHPADPDGDPYSGGAPRDGVITKFRISAYGAGGVGTPATVTFRLADITRTNPDSAQASAVGTGPTVTIAGTGEIEEFPGRLAVEKGNHLAIDTSDAHAVYASSGSDFTYVFAPPLMDGMGARTSDAVTEELLVGAVIEPDSDNDGFGDETQDSCPTDAGTQQGACPKPDTTDPRLTDVSLTSRTFTSSTKLLYRLSETATVTATVEKAGKGRRVRGKCRKQTAANAKRKRCVRYVKLPGRIRTTGGKGLNQLTLRNSIGGRKLRPGKYRLTLVARDGAGNVSAKKRIGFRVAK
jgi:hypothetical protein